MLLKMQWITVTLLTDMTEVPRLTFSGITKYFHSRDFILLSKPCSKCLAVSKQQHAQETIILNKVKMKSAKILKSDNRPDVLKAATKATCSCLQRHFIPDIVTAESV
jgi:plastocyanin domain-containing protein